MIKVKIAKKDMKQSKQEKKAKAIKNNDHELSQKGLILGHLRTI